MTIAPARSVSVEPVASSAFDDARDAALTKTFWAAVVFATAAAVPTILSARGLAYDGAYYLLAVATRGEFQLWEPARHSVQFLQQVFAFAGGRLGFHDLWTQAILFSLATAGWPLVITALCWFVLPRGQKSWIAGPLVNLVFAIPATSFIGIGEGIIASCLLWLAFLLVVFRMERPAGAIAAVLVVAACTVAHESAVLCLVAIAIAAALQVRRTKGFCRAAAVIAGLLALAGAAYMLRWIVFPRSAIERGDFLIGLFGGFIGTRGAPNIPALASAFAAVGILVALLRPSLARWASAVTVLAPACAFALLWLAPDELISPSRYFAARGLPVALTTIVMIASLYLWQARRSPARFATGPVLFIFLTLAAAQAAGQIAITSGWTSYVQALHALVDTETGAIPHARAMAALDPAGSRFRREMLEHWSVEPLSILLAPGGDVRAVVEPAPAQRWIPYRLTDLRNLPRGRGLDWSHFRARP